MLAPAELHPDLEGDLQLVDSETGARAEITADFDLLARYEERLGAWREEVAAYCRGHGMGYLLVDTGAPLEQLLFGALPAQGMAR